MAEEAKVVEVKPNLENYVDGVSGSGKKTKNCGDDVATLTNGFTLDELYSLASKMTDTPAKEYRDKYAKLNPGMQAMNLRNRIRGAVNKLDAAHEQDKAVVAGVPTLKLETEKGRAAVAKRAAAAEAEAKKKAAAAAAKAEAKAKAPAKKAKGKKAA
jgi:hypothetical protein